MNGDVTGQPHRAPAGDLSAFSRPAGRLGRLGAPPGAAAPRAAAPAAAAVESRVGAIRVPYSQVAQNPLNDRDSYEDLSNLESIRDRQINACTVLTRSAFLRLYPPDQSPQNQAAADAIGDCLFVVVAGSRRRAAVERFDVPLLKIDIIDDEVATRADFLAETIKENEYTPLNPVEEARALERLVTELGSAAAAGQRLKKSPQVVSQRRAILKFCPPMLELVRSGEIPVRVARILAPKVADLAEEEQLAAWRREQRRLLTAVKSPSEPELGEASGASPKTRRWIFTEKQTPHDVAALIRERFTGEELAAVIAALQD